jgi:pyrroline-5-carboxylate reductase
MSKVVFIGGGNMASCLIGGMLANGFSSEDILVSEPNADSRQRIEATHGISTTADNGVAVSTADIVVLAVKPQVMGAVAAPLASSLTHSPYCSFNCCGHSGVCPRKLDGGCSNHSKGHA